MSTYPLSKTENSSDLVHYFWGRVPNSHLKNVMLGRANVSTERSQRAPSGPLRAYQSNSFNNFDNSLFFVIVRPIRPKSAVASAHVKRGSKSCKPTPIFCDMKISSDLHRSHGVSDRRLGGGEGKLPRLPPPVATPLEGSIGLVPIKFCTRCGAEETHAYCIYLLSMSSGSDSH